MTKTEKEDDTILLLNLIFREKKFILILTLTGALVSFLITLPSIMPPEYMAESIIYPPASYSDRLNADYDLRFGADKEIDEHIQVLKSAVLRDSIIKKYNLLQHYDIETDHTHRLSELHNKFEDNFSVERTRYNSISISVSDIDPKMAAAMCNDMVLIGDKVKAHILKQNLSQTMISLEKSALEQISELVQSEEKINKIRPEIKFETSSLSTMSSAERFRALLSLTDYVKTAKLNGDKILLELLYNYESGLNKYIAIRDSYEKAVRNLNARIVNSYVISPAEVPDKKHKPKRFLFLIAGTVLSFVFGCGFLVLKEFFNKIKKTIQA